MPPDKREDWEFGLDAPLDDTPAALAAPTPAEAEAEGANFMAAMAMLNR